MRGFRQNRLFNCEHRRLLSELNGKGYVGNEIPEAEENRMFGMEYVKKVKNVMQNGS